MSDNKAPGIYAGIPNSDYHGGPGISKSGLDLVAKSPAHLAESRRAANDNEPRQPTKAQAIGTAFHELILEPDEFANNYVQPLNREDHPNAIEDREVLVAMIEKLNEDRLDKLPVGGSKAELVARILDNELSPDTPAEEIDGMKAADLKAVIVAANEKRPGKLKTSGSRHEMADILREHGHSVELWGDVVTGFHARNEGRVILTSEEWEMLHRMREAVLAHKSARWLLTQAPNVVVDLKTCEDASPEGFGKSVANWRYHVQHPFYLDGLRLALEQSGHEAPANGAVELSAYWNDPDTGELCRCRPDYWRGEPKHFVFLAVEKTACVVNGQPKGVATYVLQPDSVDLGRATYRADLDTYAQCVKTDTWPGYSTKIEPLELPGWVFTRAAV